MPGPVTMGTGIMQFIDVLRHGALAAGMAGLLLAGPAGAQQDQAGRQASNGAPSGVAGIPAPHFRTELVFYKLGVAQGRDGHAGLDWDGEFSAGNDTNLLRLTSEGQRIDGVSDAKAQLLFRRAVTPSWGVQLGARRDFGTGPKRDWAAFGVQGTGPYEIDTEFTAYLGGTGRTALTLKAERDLPLAPRLLFTPDIEVNLYGKDDAARGIGHGLADASLTLRLRYEITDQFAPYVGVSFGRAFGQTARDASAAGDSRSERVLLAGLRLRL